MALSNAERQRRYRQRQKAKKAPHHAQVQERTERGTFRQELSEDEIERYLGVIAAGFTIRKAALETGRDRTTWEEWRKRSEENARRYREAFDAGTQAMEEEAVRRGMYGYEEVTKNGKGDVTRTVHRYDSTILQKALAARDPAKWRDNYQAQSQPTVIVIQSAFGAVRPQPDIELQAVEMAEIPEETT